MGRCTLQVRGAHSGFLVNGEILGTDKNCCPRAVLLRANGVEEVHDEATLARFAVGNRNEDYFCDNILKGQLLQRDAEVIRDYFTGHADIIVGDTVYELKSVTSKNVQKKVFEKGEYKLSNLAQLVGYMWASGRRNGVLAYTFWEEVEGGSDYSATHAPGSTRSFAVAITDFGHIIVDGVFIPYTLKHWHDHHKMLVDAVNKPEIPQIFPKNPSEPWASPCMYCPFKAVCHALPARKVSPKSFVAAARKELAKAAKEKSVKVTKGETK